MRYANSKQKFLAALLLLIFVTGCGGGTKQNGTASRPTVISAIPPSSANGACPNTLVTVTFSKAMKASSINATSYTLSGPGSVLVPGLVTYDAASRTAIFTPSSTLALSAVYMATVTTAAVDVSGNALASDMVSSFTTGVTTCQPGPPIVISVGPPDGTNGICPNTVAVASFSTAMNPTSINASTFTLTGPGSAAVAGQVTYDAPSRAAIFTPSNPLTLGTFHTATVKTGVQDLFGNLAATAFAWTFTTAAAACQSPQVALGSVADLVVLAGSTVTNTGPTIITGADMGAQPGQRGHWISAWNTHSARGHACHRSDGGAGSGGFDHSLSLYRWSAWRRCSARGYEWPDLYPGPVQTSSTVMLSAGNVTLDAQGDVNAVFIFQVASTLTTIGSTHVVLAGGAQAKNVFWQTGSSATLGTNSIFKGTIMALQSVTLQTGVTLEGRALARNGAVTLDSNPVTAP